MNCNRTLIGFAALSAFASTFAFASPASAAPPPADPFGDFEAANPDLPPVKEIAVTSTKEETTAGGERVVPTKKGTLSFGGIASFDYAGSHLETPSGGSVSNSNFFTRLGARGSYMLFDRVDVGGTVGALFRDAGQGSAQSGWFLEANAGYLFPLSPQFAFAPRLGVGFYHGGADRDLVVNGTTTTESTSVNGLIATLYLMGAFQASRSVQIRSGLALTALAGSESVPSADKSLSSTSFFVGIPVEIDWVR